MIFKQKILNHKHQIMMRINNTKFSFKIDFFYDYGVLKKADFKIKKVFFIRLKSLKILHNKTVVNDKNFFLKELRLDNEYKCYRSMNTSITNEIMEIIKLDSFKDSIIFQ